MHTEQRFYGVISYGRTSTVITVYRRSFISCNKLSFSNLPDNSITTGAVKLNYDFGVNVTNLQRKQLMKNADKYKIVGVGHFHFASCRNISTDKIFENTYNAS